MTKTRKARSDCRQIKQAAKKQVRGCSQNAQKQEFSCLNDCFCAFCSKQSKKKFAIFSVTQFFDSLNAQSAFFVFINALFKNFIYSSLEIGWERYCKIQAF